MARRFEIAVLIVVLGLVTGAAAVETVSRAFTLHYVSVADASTAVQPLLSDEGSLTLQPSRSRITVQDYPEVIDRVARTLDELDRSPRNYRVRIELLEGGAEKPFGAANQVEADDRMRKMFKFSSYRKLGGAVVEGELGDDAQAALGIGYQVSFVAKLPTQSPDTPWGAADPGNRVHLRSLTLERLTATDGGEQARQEYLRTHILLAPHQKVYIGAGNSEDPETGLILIVEVQELRGN